MGKSDKKNKEAIEPIGLWEVNDVHISENYDRNVTEGGEVYYSKYTERCDLPDSFWENDWYADPGHQWGHFTV